MSPIPKLILPMLLASLFLTACERGPSPEDASKAA